MTVESRKVGDRVVVSVSGRMDAESAPEFEQKCEAWISQGVTNLIADLSELSYVSSMGLRSFLLIGKMLEEKGGKLRLCGQKGLVKQVFEITRLNTIFTPHDSVEGALADG